MNSIALLHAVIENAIDGIITIDERGSLKTINPSACKLFGYSPDEVTGNNISMLMPEPDRHKHDNYIARYQRTGEPHIIGIGREVKGLRKDGSTFPFRLAVSEVKFAGTTLYTGFIHDLSRAKEAEERLKQHAVQLEEMIEERTLSLRETVSALELAKEELSISLDKEKELSQMKSRFVSMASHEFRTPLSAIQLSAMLSEKYVMQSDMENVSKHLGKIKSAVAHLTTILNDFLSLEKLEAGKVQPHYSNFDIIQFGEEVKEVMQLVAKKDQSIRYQHDGLAKTVHLDRNLLKNCIINLVSNAIKYSGEDSLICFQTQCSQDQLVLKVSDNGIGIPEIDQKHLFEAFFRAHNTGNIPGTGLGLNIVTRHVALMNGCMEFKSMENQGTSFTLTFPIHHENDIDH